MGLDIYLYRYENFEVTQKKQKEYEDFSNKIWEEGDKKYDDMTDEEKDERNKKTKDFALSLGLSKWGDDEENKKCIEIDSEKYPEHYFKVGYFRSSYNDGGLNKILRNFGLVSMEDMFEVNREDYVVQPDWKKVIENLKTGLEAFKKMGGFRVKHISSNIFISDPTPRSEEEALAVFLAELDRNKNNANEYEGGYSNINGEFYPNTPLKVLGLIPGKYSLFNEQDCVYVITESENEWYYQAFEIMIDTCEYVLAQEDKDKYHLHWSG